MLEIVALYFLTKKIGALAATKGLSPNRWKLRLVIFWLLAEFIGVFFALLFFTMENIVSIELIAVAFAISAYFIIQNYLNKLPDTTNDDIDNIGR